MENSTMLVRILVFQQFQNRIEYNFPQNTLKLQLQYNIFCFHFRFFVFLLIYLIGGMLFLRFIRGAKGWEQVPNYEFWYEFPLYVRVSNISSFEHSLFGFMFHTDCLLPAKQVDLFRNLLWFSGQFDSLSCKDWWLFHVELERDRDWEKLMSGFYTDRGNRTR